jgi:hypothetical protein
MRKTRWLLRGTAVIALILPAALMLGPASADASVSPSGLFAAQARAAHLSAPQQATLQSEVNKIIARYGGHQVALNEIALPHGASMLFPLPGQRVAHVLPGTPPLPVNKAKVAQATRAARTIGTSASCTDEFPWQTGETWCAANGAQCPFYYFCSWQGQSYTGIQFNVSWCNVWQEYPGSGWDSYGSYANNQSFGVLAYLAPADKVGGVQIQGSDPEIGPDLAYSNNWAPWWYAMACRD